MRDHRQLEVNSKTALSRRRGLGIARVAVLVLIVLLCIHGGCKPRQIIRPTSQMDIDAEFWVRVLLLDTTSSCTISAVSPLRVQAGSVTPGMGGGSIRLTSAGTAVKATVSSGHISLGGQTFSDGEILVHPERPHVFSVNGHEYRGMLKLVANPDGESFDGINLVPLEPYLAGVIRAEMPDYWEPEALKAQAIAARTYCLYVKKRFGVNRDWDMSTTQSTQVYRGVGAESAKVWQAVSETHGRVLVGGGGATGGGDSVRQRDDLFPTYYSSLCGGHTESSQNVFGDSFAPLRGVHCPYCKDVAKLNLFFWPMVQFDEGLVSRRLIAKYPKLRQIGEIRNIVAVQKNDYGQFARLTRVRLEGSSGKSDTLRAEDLRLIIDPTGRKIKSTICHIAKWGDNWAFLGGRGWGHGVGMCQHGAEGMARKGMTVEQILQHYYPESKIVTVY